MNTREKGPSLKQIRKYLKSATKEIREEEKKRRYNELETRNIIAKIIAQKISNEGINTDRLNIYSNPQNTGLIEGKDGPASPIFYHLDKHMKDEENKLKSEDYKKKIYNKQVSTHKKAVSERQQKKEQKKLEEKMRWRTEYREKHPPQSKRCSPGNMGCSMMGGKKYNKTRKKRNNKRNTKRNTKRNNKRNTKRNTKFKY